MDETSSLLQQFAERYSRRDLAGLMDVVADHADVLMLGTGADERLQGRDAVRAQFERDWSQAEATRITVLASRSGAAPGCRWFIADVRFDIRMGGASAVVDGRWSGSFIEQAGGWKLVTTHFSLPAQGQDDGQSYPR